MNEVFLLDYMEGGDVSQKGNTKKARKGKRKFRNLLWEMKDGVEVVCSEGIQMSRRGKTSVKN